jgi:hypothetical protein
VRLVQLKGVPELHGTLDHIAAAIPPDAAVDDYLIDAPVVSVGVGVLLHFEETSTFWCFLDVRD